MSKNEEASSKPTFTPRSLSLSSYNFEHQRNGERIIDEIKIKKGNSEESRWSECSPSLLSLSEKIALA